MLVLTFNAGSSSLKHTLIDLPQEREVDRGIAEELPAEGHAAAAARVLDDLAARGRSPAAVGHRIVHGGPSMDAPVTVEDLVLALLDELAPLAPLHMPAQLRVLRVAMERLPGVPHVACFDTAFHRRMPEVAQRLPLPDAYWRRGIRRYGFHGLSYEFVLGALGAEVPSRTVICHLGNGASMAAVRDGRPVDTTMSFTPTAGLMMGTRTGDLDPGVLIHLMRADGLDADALDGLVNRGSGLLGVGGASDMRRLLAERARDPAAALAVDMFCHAARRQVGALAASLGGVELLVFTGGIGEHAAPVREGICEGLQHLGVRLDPGRNTAGLGVVSADGGACAVRVVRTDEDLVIARAAGAATRG